MLRWFEEVGHEFCIKGAGANTGISREDKMQARRYLGVHSGLFVKRPFTKPTW